MSLRDFAFKSSLSAAVSMAAGLPMAVLAQHELEQHTIEEVFVTGEMAKTAAETALPVTALGDEALRKALQGTLGETLDEQPGVHSAGFGPGVGLPVIRGQSGPRVAVLQNGLSSLDAAATSQDHAAGLDPLVVERIEIIRGPATLLYGNGAIGGVVNVIDNRIPEVLPETFTGAVEVRRETASAANSAAVKLEGAQGSFAWHLDGAFRDADDTRIPGYAMSSDVHPNAEKHDADEHGDEDQHTEASDADSVAEEVRNTYGFIDNSDTRRHSYALGGSWIGNRGFIGLAVSHLENEYGLPPGSHLHEDDHEEHDHDHDHDHEHETEHDEHEEHSEDLHDESEHDAHAQHSDVRIDLRQTRYEVKAAIDHSGPFDRYTARMVFNDYEHTELLTDDIHPEEPAEAEHGDTRFTNRGLEGRFSGHYERSDNWDGMTGMQFSRSEFAVSGDEGFVPTTDIESLGIFAMESLEHENWIYEAGMRLQHISFAPHGGCSQRDLSWSANAAAIWQFSESTNTSVSVSRSQRAAGVEERYSNVVSGECALASEEEWKVHSPTGLIELGNPNLNEETSNNVELAVHRHLGDVHGQLSVFANKVDDYIFLLPVDEHEDVARYQQEDAEFYGYEAEINWPLTISHSRTVEFTAFSDFVFAELSSGAYLPRTPPQRNGVEVALLEQDWTLGVRVTQVADADYLSADESSTEGYTLLDLSADYHLTWGTTEFLIFARGTNMLDEEIRHHTSFAKNFAPEAGRGLTVGTRMSF